MDSLSQIVLGSSVAMACGGKVLGRKTLLIGAILGTLPDLDVLISYDNAVEDVTKHRGFSHSLFVLLPFSILLFALAHRLSASVRERPWPVFWMICLSLITHPLLDAFTTYGTQLFWPLMLPPVALSSIFIIDPLYTLPLLIALLYLAVKDRSWQQQLRVSSAALIISSAYLLWTLLAQSYVQRQFEQNFAAKIETSLVTPLPFNSLYWRVLWLDQGRYYEAFMPLWRLNFEAEPQAQQRQLIANFDSEQLDRLRWFSGDKLKFSRQGEQLVATDLRMGSRDFFPFNFVIAEYKQGHWHSVPSQLLPATRPSWQDLKTFWQTI